MNIKQQAKDNFIKYLEAYFDEKFSEFTYKRISRMIDDYDEAIPKILVGDVDSFKKGYKEGYGDAKKYYTKKINDDNNIGSVLL